MSRLILHIPPGRPWGLGNLSPFCTKLETYLRMTETPYDSKPPSMSGAPKGKIPYVTLGGELIGDSQLVMERLERDRGERALDHGLSERERATGRAVRRMLEEGTYFTGIHMRWIRDEGFAMISPEMKKLIPGPAGLILRLIRSKLRKTLHGQGTGRHSHEEIVALAIADYQAVSALLGDQPYLLGESPRTVDATVYAFLEGVLRPPLDSEIKRAVLGMANLVAYTERLRKRYWSDLAEG